MRAFALAGEVVASLFPDIFISINILEWQSAESLDAVYLLGSYRTPFHHLFINGDNVTLVSAQDFSAAYENDKEAYYNLHLGFNDRLKKPTTAALQKIVKLKFLNGESSYSKDELDFLKNWISEAGSRKMSHFFTSIILNNQPDKYAAFNGSMLQKTFASTLD